MQPYPNRKLRRSAQALERKTGGVVVDTDELARLHAMQRLFVGIIKDQGRVRVSKDTLEGLQPGDRITSKDDGAGGLVLSYVAEPQEGTG